MPEGSDEELRQGLKRREEAGARSDLVMEGAVLEEVWGGEGGLSAGRGAHSKRGQGCLKGSAGKSDCC